MLHNKAIIGKIMYEMSQIKSNAKYVDPPPKPTLEYNMAVIKNSIDSNDIINYSIT